MLAFLRKLLPLCALSLLMTGCAGRGNSVDAERYWTEHYQPLTFGPLSLSSAVFNPVAEKAVLTANVSGVLDISAAVEPLEGGTPIRMLQPALEDGSMRVSWDGRGDDGRPAPVGAYRFRLEAHDIDGSLSLLTSPPVQLTDKVIVISLTQQDIVAYQGTKTVIHSLVSTGGPELPTPIGIFHILDKTSPLVMYSPWPKGSPNWYPDSTVQHALEFYENEAYGLYIHDASWRSYFGPGSNETAGTPGEDDTGTHGCINVPAAEQDVLYKWADVGTPVVVQL